MFTIVVILFLFNLVIRWRTCTKIILWSDIRVTSVNVNTKRLKWQTWLGKNTAMEGTC